MSYRKKLFSCRRLYDTEGTKDLFLHAVKESLAYHRANCPDYAKILGSRKFKEDGLKSVSDLHKIPAIPTVFLKEHTLLSVPYERLLFKSTSSGTRGKPSTAGLDLKSAYFALRMVLRTFSYYHLFSPVPANYIVLGYEPSPRNQMGAVKTAFGMTLAAPALHREYALKDTGTEYRLNMAGIKNALLRYEKSGFPVRFMGFPAYLHFLLKDLQESGVKLRLPKNSRVFLAGGWKQFFMQETDKSELYRLSEEILGIGEENCKDFFGAVEHPIVYCDCKNHHFHVPVYSRVIIRDVKTLLPVENGTPGLLNLITPLVGSMPLTSVMTDDLAVMYEGKTCGCGIPSPYFEILGRSGMQQIKTCAAGAAELLGGIKL